MSLERATSQPMGQAQQKLYFQTRRPSFSHPTRCPVSGLGTGVDQRSEGHFFWGQARDILSFQQPCEGISHLCGESNHPCGGLHTPGWRIHPPWQGQVEDLPQPPRSASPCRGLAPDKLTTEVSPTSFTCFCHILRQTQPPFHAVVRPPKTKFSPWLPYYKVPNSHKRNLLSTIMKCEEYYWILSCIYLQQRQSCWL